MSAKSSLVLVAVILGLAGAGGGAYYVLAVLPKKQAVERAYDEHLAAGKELLELKHDGSGALNELRESSKLFPDRIEPRVYMGLALADLARYGEAITQLEALIDERPEPELEAEISLCLGKSFLARFRDTNNRRDLGEARIHLERASQRPSTKVEALFNLGALYLAQWQGKEKPSLDDPDLEKVKRYWDEAFAIDAASEMAQTFRKPYSRLFERDKNAAPAEHP